MTAASFAHLPLQVGGVALAQAGRAALWVIARYMRNPLTNSAIAALVVTTAMAGSNALYGQRGEHPSPLFTPHEAAAIADVDPVIPAVKPKGLGEKPLVVGTPRTRVTAPAANGGPVGNADVFEVQRKLEQMQLFTGKIDGYYGPQTARAIRSFEESQGLKPMGELTPDIVQRIKAAPLAAAPKLEVQAPVAPAPAAVVAPQPAVEAQPVATPVVLPRVEAPAVETALPESRPVADASDAVAPQTLAVLAQPAPLELTTGSIATPEMPKQLESAKVLGRPLPDTPEEALEMAADTAGEAIETIISGVQTVAMNSPGRAASFAPAGEPLTTTPETRVAATPDSPQVGVPLIIDEPAPKPGTAIAELTTAATPGEIAPVLVSDPVTVAKVQRGLGSLGFLHGPADGVAGEATAKAIRNFEVYFNYKVTGRISPELLDLLVENGASI